MLWEGKTWIRQAVGLAFGWFRDVYRSRRLILDLAGKGFLKADTRLLIWGIIWAFVQPIVTVSIYILVFQVGFKLGMKKCTFCTLADGGNCAIFYFSGSTSQRHKQPDGVFLSGEKGSV